MTRLGERGVLPVQSLFGMADDEYGLLGRTRKRGREREAEEENDQQSRESHRCELLFPHGITSSARARIAGDRTRPRAFAAFVFTTSSNCVGCSTGKSAGLAPFKILST